MIKERYFCVLCFVLVIALVLALHQGSLASDQDLAAKTEPGEAGLRLSLDKLIKMIHERNERIQFQKLEWDISQDAVKNAESIFEPSVIASYTHIDNSIPNSTEEEAARNPLGFLGVTSPRYTERNKEYDAALEFLLPTGGQMRVGYTLRELSNSLMELRPYDVEYKTFMGASVVQPLLKNAGIDVTMANIRVAEADADMARQTYRREMLQVVAEASAAYWNLSLAQEKLKVRGESIRIAEEILRDNRERVRTGKMAETEILEAEAGLALRKSLEFAVKQELMAAVNNIKTLFSSPAGELEGLITASDRLILPETKVDFESSYRESLQMRPEYIATMRKIEREGIRVAYAKNQKWPQLDLKASYGINGLDSESHRKSWNMAKNREHKSVTVGLELRIPIRGGRKAQSELAAAKRRQQQTLLELKATQVALGNAVDTSIKNLENALLQAGSYEKAVRLNERLLEIELARLNAGVSNSRLVLDRDEELNRAREHYLESLVNVQKALIALESVKGTLLRNHGIDIREEL